MKRVVIPYELSTSDTPEFSLQFAINDLQNSVTNDMTANNIQSFTRFVPMISIGAGTFLKSFQLAQTNFTFGTLNAIFTDIQQQLAALIAYNEITPDRIYGFIIIEDDASANGGGSSDAG